MTDRKQTRALNAFAAMSRIPDNYILAAEQMLYEAEAGITRPAKPMGGFRRFLNSGWGAAVISGIVALAVLIFIIRAGKEPPTYDPPKQPAGSTIEMSDHGVNFTIATEMENYPEGTERITAVMTGKTKGERVNRYNAWHLEKLTSDGAVTVGIAYPEDAGYDEPERDEYAKLTQSIRITKPLTPGTYRLHATEYDGEKYVSVAWCEFTVGETVRESETEAETVTSPEAPKLPFTVTLTQSIYTTRDVSLSVHFRANEPGVPLSRGDCWSLYRMEDGERIHLGSQTAEYAFEGEEVAPDEYAEEHYTLSISKATGGNYSALPVGEYELIFDEYGMTLSFEVADGPTCPTSHLGMSSHIPYYIRRGYFITDGTHRYFVAELSPNMSTRFYEFYFEAEAVKEKYADLNSGDYVEVLLGCSHEEVPSDTKSIYGIRKLEDGTVDTLPERLRAELESRGIDLDTLQ